MPPAARSSPILSPERAFSNGGEADIVSGCGFQPQYLQVNFRVPLRLEAAATILKTPSESRRNFGTLMVT